MTRPPIVGAALWTAVMKNAGDRCECRGACGSKHAKDRKRVQGRCERYNGQHVSKKGAVVLLAIPRDPTTPFSEAAQLPASRLIAYCPDCQKAVQKIVDAAAAAMVPQTDGLFAVEEFVVSKASKKQAEVGAA